MNHQAHYRTAQSANNSELCDLGGEETIDGNTEKLDIRIDWSRW